MLEYLSIKDFALVDSLTLELTPGFWVLTGETGAGKSILLNALSCILGGRAGRDLVRTGAESARVEGTFALKGESATAVAGILEQAGIDFDGELVIRRVVGADGKSKAFVNGSAVGLALLSEVGERLVEVSSQHQHQSLMDEKHHLGMLDASLTGEDAKTLVEFKGVFAEYEKALLEVNKLKKLALEGDERRDFLLFVTEEIKSANLIVGEEEELKAERELLANSEKLTSYYGEAEGELYSNDGSVMEALGKIARVLDKAAQKDAGAQAIAKLLEQGRNYVDEAHSQLSERLRAVKADPARLEAVEERLALIHKYTRKHGGSIPSVLVKLAEMTAELELLMHRDSALADAELALEKVTIAVNLAAAKLSRARQKASAELCGLVNIELSHLGIRNDAFSVELEKAELSSTGDQTARFLFSPNPGEAPKPLARIASGGELSRVMLALKTALRDGAVETLVFDEVDAGIGGVVADKVGEKLKSLADSCQVVCVTHLPQIASLAPNHLKVEKTVENGRTITRVVKIEGDQRVEEFLRLLGGAGEKAVEHARELAQRSVA